MTKKKIIEQRKRMVMIRKSDNLNCMIYEKIQKLLGLFIKMRRKIDKNHNDLITYLHEDR